MEVFFRSDEVKLENSLLTYTRTRGAADAVGYPMDFVDQVGICIPNGSSEFQSKLCIFITVIHLEYISNNAKISSK